MGARQVTEGNGYVDAKRLVCRKTKIPTFSVVYQNTIIRRSFGLQPSDPSLPLAGDIGNRRSNQVIAYSCVFFCNATYTDLFVSYEALHVIPGCFVVHFAYQC